MTYLIELQLEEVFRSIRKIKQFQSSYNSGQSCILKLFTNDVCSFYDYDSHCENKLLMSIITSQ